MGQRMDQNQLNSNYVDAGDYQYTNANELKTIIEEIIDNKLPNRMKTIFFVHFTFGASYKMIVQKYKNNGYASCIVISYSLSNIMYKRKESGKWLS